MLSGLLKSDIAVKVNVQIIDAFVAMRKYISNTLVNQIFINNLVYKHDEEIKLLINILSLRFLGRFSIKINHLILVMLSIIEI